MIAGHLLGGLLRAAFAAAAALFLLATFQPTAEAGGGRAKALAPAEEPGASPPLPERAPGEAKARGVRGSDEELSDLDQLLGEPAGSPPPGVDEPGLLHLEGASGESGGHPGTGGYFRRMEKGPTLKAGYRFFSVSDMGDTTDYYHLLEVEYYFVSWFVRAAGGMEVGFDSNPRSNVLIAATLRGGVQYPYRITPFCDLVVSLGALKRDVFDQDLWGFAYSFGIDLGGEFFVTDRFLLSLALGWRRPVFRYTGNVSVQPADVYFDSFTLRVAAGF